MPSGPVRWTVDACCSWVSAVCLLLDPCDSSGVERSGGWVRRRLGGVVWAGCCVAFLAGAGADSLHAWIGTPDRRLGWLAWLHVPPAVRVRAGGRRRRATGGSCCGAPSIAAGVARRVVRVRAGGLVTDRRDVRRASRRRSVRATRVRRRGRGVARRRWRWGSRLTAPVRACGGASVRSARLGVGGRVVLSADAWGVDRRRGRARPARESAQCGCAQALARDRARGRRGRRVVRGHAARWAGHATRFDLGHGTTRGRFDDWAVGARVVENHPVSGRRPRGLSCRVPASRLRELLQRYGTEVIPDRAAQRPHRRGHERRRRRRTPLYAACSCWSCRGRGGRCAGAIH